MHKDGPLKCIKYNEYINLEEQILKLQKGRIVSGTNKLHNTWKKIMHIASFHMKWHGINEISCYNFYQRRGVLGNYSKLCCFE